MSPTESSSYHWWVSEINAMCGLYLYDLICLKARSHSALRLNHGQNPSKSDLPWSRRCCSRWYRVKDELQSIYRHGRTRGKIGTASDVAKSFELLKILAHGQPRVAHVVKTCNTRETHVIIRVPAVIKTWGDAVRRESLGICHGQSTVIRWVLRVGITGNSVCLAAYHWQIYFPVLRQCLGIASAVEQPPTAIPRHKARPSQNWPKITTYDHVHQIFITSCTWFRRGVLCDRGLSYVVIPVYQVIYTKNFCSFCVWLYEQLVVDFNSGCIPDIQGFWMDIGRVWLSQFQWSTLELMGKIDQ